MSTLGEDGLDFRRVELGVEVDAWHVDDDQCAHALPDGVFSSIITGKYPVSAAEEQGQRVQRPVVRGERRIPA